MMTRWSNGLWRQLHPRYWIARLTSLTRLSLSGIHVAMTSQTIFIFFSRGSRFAGSGMSCLLICYVLCKFQSAHREDLWDGTLACSAHKARSLEGNLSRFKLNLLLDLNTLSREPTVALLPVNVYCAPDWVFLENYDPGKHCQSYQHNTS